MCIIFTQVNLQQQYVKALLSLQVAQPMSFGRFHGLSLKLIVNFVKPDILPNTSPLLAPILPHRAHGFLDVVVAVPPIVFLIVSVIFDVPLFVAVPFIPLIGKN